VTISLREGVFFLQKGAGAERDKSECGSEEIGEARINHYVRLARASHWAGLARQSAQSFFFFLVTTENNSSFACCFFAFSCKLLSVCLDVLTLFRGDFYVKYSDSQNA